MKTFIKLLVLCAVVCMVSSAGSAQKKSRKKPGTAHPICKVESVPKGMVIVSHKTNPRCEEGFEFVVKQPAAAEKVCANSPVPEGYSVDEVTGSSSCTGVNPLTNAYVISNGGLYGIKIGMTSMKVSQILGPPAQLSRGTKDNPGKGYTWSYRGPFNTLHVYFDDNSTVSSLEEKKGRN